MLPGLLRVAVRHHTSRIYHWGAHAEQKGQVWAVDCKIRNISNSESDPREDGQCETKEYESTTTRTLLRRTGGVQDAIHMIVAKCLSGFGMWEGTSAFFLE